PQQSFPVRFVITATPTSLRSSRWLPWWPVKLGPLAGIVSLLQVLHCLVRQTVLGKPRIGGRDPRARPVHLAAEVELPGIADAFDPLPAEFGRTGQPKQRRRRSLDGPTVVSCQDRWMAAHPGGSWQAGWPHGDRGTK